jgi:hypothetical protein
MEASLFHDDYIKKEEPQREGGGDCQLTDYIFSLLTFTGWIAREKHRIS